MLPVSRRPCSQCPGPFQSRYLAYPRVLEEEEDARPSPLPAEDVARRLGLDSAPGYSRTMQVITNIAGCYRTLKAVPVGVYTANRHEQ